MPIVNYYIDNSETPTPVDVPEGLNKEEQDIWTNEFYLPYHDSGLAAAEEDPEHPLAFAPDFAARGLYQLGKGYNAIQERLGFNNPEEAAKDIAKFESYLQQVPYDENVLDAMNAWSKADSAKEWWDVATTPSGLEMIATIAGQSATQFLPVLGTAGAASLAGAGTILMAAIGGIGSLGIEYGASLVDAMDEYLAKDGKTSKDNKAVAKVLGDDTKMAEFGEIALKRGVTIGAIDALSLGIAGKLTSVVNRATKNAKRFSKAAPRGAFAIEALAMQPALGGVGEYAAQKVAGQKLKMGDVILETLAEGPTGAMEVGLGLFLEGRKERKIQEEKEFLEQALQEREANAKAYEEEQKQLKERQTKQQEVNKVRSDLTIDINENNETEAGQKYIDHLFDHAKSNNKPVKAKKPLGNKQDIKKIFDFADDRSAVEVSDYLIEAGYATKKRGKLIFTEKAEEIFNNPILEQQQQQQQQQQQEQEQEQKQEEVTEDQKNLEAYIQAQIDETGSLPVMGLEDISDMESLTAFTEAIGSQVAEGKKLRAKALKLSKNKGSKDFPSYVVTHPNAESYLEGTGNSEIRIEKSVDDPSVWVVDGAPDIDSTFSQRRDAIASVKEVLDNYERRDTGFKSTSESLKEIDIGPMEEISEPLQEVDIGPMEERIEGEIETFSEIIEPYRDETEVPQIRIDPTTGEYVDVPSDQELQRQRFNRQLEREIVDKTSQLRENVKRDFQNIEKIQKEIDRLEALPKQRIAQRNPLSPELEIQRQERLDILSGELIATAEQYQQSRSALETEDNRLRQKPFVKSSPVDETFTEFDIKTEVTEFLNFEVDEVIPEPYIEAAIDSPSIITNLEENGRRVGRLANVEPEQVDRILEAVPDNNPKKEKYKKFQLDITPPVSPDSEQANVDEILITQKIEKDLSPVDHKDLDLEYTSDAYKDIMPLVTVANHNLATATSEQERAEIKKNSEVVLNEMSTAELINKSVTAAWKVFHPTRLAEKYPIFGRFYRFIMARRESREQKNNKWMNIVRDFYKNTPPDMLQKLGLVTTILDGLSGRTNPIISPSNIQRTREGGLIIDLPESPPLDRKTGEPIISMERYEAILEEWNVTPNEVIQLTPEEHKKLRTTQQAFKEVYNGYAKALMDYTLQKNPIHRSIKIESTDNLPTYRSKLNKSIELFINEINEVLPETKKIQATPSQINNIRIDSKLFETISKLLKEERIKEDQFAQAKVKRSLAHLNLMKLLNNIQQTLKDHPYYIPRLRSGEWYFTVTDKKGKIIGNHVSNPLTFDTVVDAIPLRKGQNKSQQRKRLSKRRERIKKIYEPKGFIVNEIKKSTLKDVEEQFNQKHISFLETIASGLGYNLNNPTRDPVEASIVDKFIKEIDNRIQEKGFDKYIAQRSPELITGYYNEDNKQNYLANTLSTYIRTGADTASNLEFYNPIIQSIKTMEKTGTKESVRLAEIATNLNKFIHDPNEPGGKVKSFAFLWALGFNVSSAAINASQSFTVTVPTLKSIIGFTGPTSRAATSQVVKGLNNAVRLFRTGRSANLDSYGFRFDSQTLPKEYSSFLTQDEWTMLRELYGQGVIQAIVNLDLGAKYRTALGESGRLTPVAAKNAERIMDASAYAFGAQEQINRIAAALAFYRSAQKKGQLKKFARFAEGTIFRNDEMTPTTAAKMGVYKTQFFIGKENRMEVLRPGIFNVASQFLSFVLQYSGTFAFALNRFKVDKKVGSYLLGNLFLGMMVWGGLMGLPFAKDIDRILRMATRSTGKEYSIEWGIRENLKDMGLPAWATESIMTGAVGQITGTNIGSRVGTGQILPSGLFANELTAAGGPALSLVSQAVQKVGRRIGRDDWKGAISAGLPLGIQNFYENIERLTATDPRDIETSRGQTLIPGEKLSVPDLLKGALGFRPSITQTINQIKDYERYLEGQSMGLKNYYTDKMSRAIHEGNKELVAKLQKEILRRNEEAIIKNRPQDIIDIQPTTIRDRILTLILGDTTGIDSTKKLRGQIRDMIEYSLPKK